MDIVKGYAIIKEDATTCKGALNPDDFIGKTLIVHDFGYDDSVLVINQQGTALAMFDKIDVKTSFRCSQVNDFILPPNLNELEKMAYMSRCLERKGGYGNIVKNFVIHYSLLKGRFDDSIIWQKQ